MSSLFRLSGGVRRDPSVEAWLAGPVRLDRQADALFPEPANDLRAMARAWFERMRACGEDVRELIHDGCPTTCVGDAAFAYVNVFKAHVNIGFYNGAGLDDPARLLQGEGRRMRHVKLRPDEAVDAEALGELIEAAYRDARARLAAEGG